MIENDTIRLLRECDAGITMGVDSIGDVVDRVHSESLRKMLEHCCREHEKLRSQVRQKLDTCHDTGKDPNPIAKGMSWMKTNVKLNLDSSDSVIAELMTDGCNMGVKSLSRYLNQYKAADEGARKIAADLIRLEADLAADIRAYL